MPAFRFITRRIDACRQRTFDGVEVVWENVLKGGLLALIIATIIWISIFLYVMFYYLYMPSMSHIRPVHLQFVSCDEVHQCVDGKGGLCSYPSAHVQLTRKQRILMIGQPYKIFINLEMPESPTNFDLGMFMVCSRLFDKDGILVSSACRATMLHYRSQFLHVLRMLVYSPLFVVGNKEEKQLITVELYNDFEDTQSHPVTDVHIEVQSREVQLYSATLHIQAHLTGLRYVMFHWPTLSAVLGIASNLLVIFFISSLSWWQLHFQHEYGKNFMMEFLRNRFFFCRQRRRGLPYVADSSENKDKDDSEEAASEEVASKESSSGAGSDSETTPTPTRSSFFREVTGQELSDYLEAED